jgi:hypothetical protein
MDKEKFYQARKPFNEILSDGVRLFQENYKTLIIPLAIFSIISIIVNILLLTDLEWIFGSVYSQASPILNQITSDYTYMPTNAELELIMNVLLFMIIELVIQMLIGTIFTIIAVCSVASYLYKVYLRQDVKFSDEFKKAFNSKMLLAILLLGIFIPLGTFLLFIPSLFILGFYFFFVFTYNDEGSKNPLSEARSISKGAFWRIIGILLICSLIQMSVNYVYSYIIDYAWGVNNAMYSSWVNPDTRNYSMLILYGLVNNIPDILLAPLFVCFVTPLFASHKARFELGHLYEPSYYARWRDQEQRAPLQSLRHPLEDVEPVPSTQKGKGFYCPFCGYYIKTPKKFCTSCGETLDFKF